MGNRHYKLFRSEPFDICLLDVMLPKLDGFTLARIIRKENEEIPIIFISAKSLTEDKIEGLLLGADDYIVKPFNIEELTLKIEIFLKRSRIHKSSPSLNIFHIGNCLLDMNLLQLDCSGEYKKADLPGSRTYQLFEQQPEQAFKQGTDPRSGLGR